MIDQRCVMIKIVCIRSVLIRWRSDNLMSEGKGGHSLTLVIRMQNTDHVSMFCDLSDLSQTSHRGLCSRHDISPPMKGLEQEPNWWWICVIVERQLQHDELSQSGDP